AVGRIVELALGGVDADLTEHALHAEGTRLVRHDGHDALADLLVLDEVGEQAHEGHRGGNLAVASALGLRFEGRQRGDFQLLAVRAALRQQAAHARTHLAQVLHLRAVFRRTVVGNLLQLVVRNRDAEAVAEGLEFVDRDLLRAVGRVGAFRGGEGITLDGLGQNDRRTFLAVDSLLVGSVDLVGVVAAAVQVHQVVVAEVFHQLEQFGVLAEEVLADVGATASLVGLVLAVHGLVHALLQQTRLVLGQQGIPVAAPDHLDHVPAGTTEDAFQLLDDLAVAAHRPVETLQVAVDDEVQVAEAFARGEADGAQSFRLVALAVAEEGPDLAVTERHQTTAVKVLQDVGHVDGLQGAESHRHGGELPEVRHQPGVRVGGQTVAIHFLAELVELCFAQAAFNKGAGIHARGGVALEVDQVTEEVLAGAAEEIVE